MICVDLFTTVPKVSKNNITSREYRKLRSNPQYFLNNLAQVEWELLVKLTDVDDMENMWTSEINKCLDSAAPWKTRKLKSKRYSLSREISIEM